MVVIVNRGIILSSTLEVLAALASFKASVAISAVANSAALAGPTVLY